MHLRGPSVLGSNFALSYDTEPFSDDTLAYPPIEIMARSKDIGYCVHRWRAIYGLSLFQLLVEK